MIKKLLRTIIELPIVVLAWPLAAALAFCAICGESLVWVLTGRMNPSEVWDWLTDIVCLPYKWLKEVWK